MNLKTLKKSKTKHKEEKKIEKCSLIVEIVNKIKWYNMYVTGVPEGEEGEE